MSDDPLVSVVTPTWNRPRRILDAIRTVNRQNYPNIEHVIVDGNSDVPIDEAIAESDVTTEDSVELVLEIQSQNEGLSAARNRGIELADGEFIAFLDDDDEWHRDKLTRQVRKGQSTDAGVIYSGVEQQVNDRIIATQIPTVQGDITRDLLTGTPIKSPSTVMVRPDVADEIDGFDPRFDTYEDLDFYIRASKVTTFDGVRDVLVTRQHHESQISRDYCNKRDISVPLLREKHQALAERYGVENEFNTTLESILGASAIDAGEFRAARTHYFRAFCRSPTRATLINLLAVAGGGLTYRPLRYIRRRL